MYNIPTFSRVAVKIADERQLSIVSVRRDIELPKRSVWLSDTAIYVNRDTGKIYRPHNESEADFVYNDQPRRVMIKGGEGSGKSVAGIIKNLERVRRGMSGIMGSPNFVHFKKSLWPEFRRWCPPNALVPKHRYRLEPDWAPTMPFELVFKTGASIMCGGFDSPGSWEGPNISWAHFDEARHHANAQMAKVLDGRCRIAGPKNESPQWWITTTPRKSRMSSSPDDDQYHWMYIMFGPWTDKSKEDPYASFKRQSKVITLRLSDNAENLADGYVESRSESLTESESSVLVDAEWADEESLERFLRTMLWWDACEESLPPLDPRQPMVVALDAAVGRSATASDCFAIVGVTRHPNDRKRVAVRKVEAWQSLAGKEINYKGTDGDPGPETYLINLSKIQNIVCVCFDPYQLIDMSQRLELSYGIWFDKFGQVSRRLEADRSLLSNITSRVVAHDGDKLLWNHIDNADRKVDDSGSKFRLVKGRGRIDCAVGLSMGTWQCLDLNI